MGGLLVQFLGLFALLGLAAWGYRHWISPRRGVGIQGKGMLLLCVVTLVGGLLGSTGWWIDDPKSFSWDLPPLASRMLACAGWAFGIATLAALRRPVPRRTRLVMLMLAVYLSPLLVSAPLFHLDRFDAAAPITYVFFALVLTMTVAVLWYLFKQPVIVPNEPADSLAPTELLGRWLGLVAAVCALWGLALFVTDDGPSALIWVWPGDLLTSRLIAVMLLTIALGAV
jgi:surface polysaccharide O-acyltransferase-like enzyme